jgi:gluconate 5-dehydrogenase
MAERGVRAVTAADSPLAGQVALVTGASRGLGYEIAKAFAGAGAFVYLNARPTTALEAAVERITGAGGAAAALAFDVTDETAAIAALARLEGRAGRLDILVNNVGIRDRRGLLEFDTAALQRLIEVNLVAPFALCREAARLMIPRRAGRLINVTSIAGPIARAGDPAYTASKGGLEALTRALAAELGPQGITANAIAPGYFATEANAAMAADPEIAAWLAKRTALGRWGRPEEIAAAALFFASPAASYVTGQVLAVDGGYVAHF